MLSWDDFWNPRDAVARMMPQLECVPTNSCVGNIIPLVAYSGVWKWTLEVTRIRYASGSGAKEGIRGVGRQETQVCTLFLFHQVRPSAIL